MKRIVMALIVWMAAAGAGAVEWPQIPARSIVLGERGSSAVTTMTKAWADARPAVAGTAGVGNFAVQGATSTTLAWTAPQTLTVGHATTATATTGAAATATTATVALDAQAHIATTTNVHGLTFTGEGAGGGLDADTLDGQQGTYYATSATAAAHIANTSNPHSVTRAQVGAGASDSPGFAGVSSTGSFFLPDTTTTSTGVLYKNSLAFLHNYPGGTRRNTYLGYYAGNLTGTPRTNEGNTGIGYKALNDLTNGSTNVAVGQYALTHCTTGINNIAVGDDALHTNTSGYSNNAIGVAALYYNTIGTENAAFGAYALRMNIDGDCNYAVGPHSLQYNTTGDFNLGIGYGSGYWNSTGSLNTQVGCYALYYNLTGGNTALGYQAGRGDNATVNRRSYLDTYSMFLGYQASRASGVTTSTVLTNAISIGKDAQVGASNTMALGGTGADAISVVIGGTTATQKLDVIGDIRATGGLYTGGSAGVAGTQRIDNMGQLTGTTTTLTGALKLTPRADVPSSPTAGMIWMGTDGHFYGHGGGVTRQLDN